MKKIYLFLLITLIGCQKDPIKFNLTVAASPPEGGLINPTSGVYNEGENVVINAVANNFYVFKNWSGGWAGSSPTIILTMDSDKQLIANFEKNDLDEDGVVNQNDLCPNTISGSVDSNGCALSQKDTDGDGITDDLDQCENTDPNSAIINSSGCKVDLFYLADNNYTIKAIEEAQVGMVDTFEGNEYEIVNFPTLKDMIKDGRDVTFVVTSKMINFRELFWNYPVVGDITRWDTSNIEFMGKMFKGNSFNQNIGSWDVSKVINMRNMFANTPFNRDIRNWNVSNVKNMAQMFNNSNFNNVIRDWDVSNVTTMGSMFSRTPFSQDISNWDVSNLTDMSYMFSDSSFMGDISNWDVSNVLYMNGTFKGTPFNGDISNWDVSSVIEMAYMFDDTTMFNQDISNWDVSNVTNMQSMFNGDIRTGNVFWRTPFNQDISSWDVSSVTNMEYMFMNAEFNQNLTNWDVSSVTNCRFFNIQSFFQNQNIPLFTNCSVD